MRNSCWIGSRISAGIVEGLNNQIRIVDDLIASAVAKRWKSSFFIC